MKLFPDEDELVVREPSTWHVLLLLVTAVATAALFYSLAAA
jgi:hypothetical protein